MIFKKSLILTVSAIMIFALLGGCQSTSEAAAVADTTFYAQITGIEGYNITLAVVNPNGGESTENADVVSSATETSNMNTEEPITTEDNSNAVDAISSATQEQSSSTGASAIGGNNNAVDAVSSATQQQSSSAGASVTEGNSTSVVDATSSATIEDSDDNSDDESDDDSDDESENDSDDDIVTRSNLNSSDVEVISSATTEAVQSNIPAGDEPGITQINPQTDENSEDNNLGVVLTGEVMTVRVTGKTFVILPSDTGSEYGFVSQLAVGDIVLVTMTGDSLRSIAKQVGFQ